MRSKLATCSLFLKLSNYYNMFCLNIYVKKWQNWLSLMVVCTYIFSNLKQMKILHELFYDKFCKIFIFRLKMFVVDNIYLKDRTCLNKQLFGV